MDKASFIINGKVHEVSIHGSPAFHFGKDELLSTAERDITFNQPWYREGYQAINFLTDDEFLHLKQGLTICVKNIIKAELGIDAPDFELNKYHQIVKTDADHFKIVSKTRDLFPGDFNFPVNEFFPKFEKLLGFKLTDINPYDGLKIHIIVRINRPFSTDYNPPHKDIYEGFDGPDHYIPQFVNLWIPICGVTQNSSLPIAPFSHLIPEDKVLRTFEGGVVENKNYRVRMIKEWNGSSEMLRAEVPYGDVLFFTSHLIHGLAINEEPDDTRVALEFRLFKEI